MLLFNCLHLQRFVICEVIDYLWDIEILDFYFLQNLVRVFLSRFYATFSLNSFIILNTK